MVAAILIGAVIAILGAMAANEVMIYQEYPWVSQVNILPIIILMGTLTAFLLLLV